MRKKPVFLYHYTNIDSAISIIKSGTWRLYEARSQNDPFEIVYFGDIVLNLFIEIIKNKEQYSKYQIIAILHCLFFIKMYFCNTNTELSLNIDNMIMQLSNENYFKEFTNTLINRKIDLLFLVSQIIQKTTIFGKNLLKIIQE